MGSTIKKDDGWQFAEVEFTSTISESEFCVCDACHKTGKVMKLTLPETAYYRNGQLSTKYREYWLCPSCRRKLVHALDWPRLQVGAGRRRKEQ